MVTSTDGNGVQTTYIYDELDRKKSDSVMAGTEHKNVYGYDLNGNLTITVDWKKSTYKNAYDTLNRLYERRDPKDVAYEKLE